MKVFTLLLCDCPLMVAASEYFVTTLSDGSDCPAATECIVLSFYTLNQKDFLYSEPKGLLPPGHHLPFFGRN